MRSILTETLFHFSSKMKWFFHVYKLIMANKMTESKEIGCWRCQNILSTPRIWHTFYGQWYYIYLVNNVIIYILDTSKRCTWVCVKSVQCTWQSVFVGIWAWRLVIYEFSCFINIKSYGWKRNRKTEFVSHLRMISAFHACFHFHFHFGIRDVCTAESF